VVDESLLIRRASNGDKDAFRKLVEGSKIGVYRLAYDMVRNHHDAEDISQDVFLHAYRSLGSFRGESKWSTWLYRITVNACLDRKKSRVRTMTDYKETMDNEVYPAAGSSTGKNISPDRSADSSLIQQHIDKSLDQLSEQERTVFVLRHYHDLPLKQIAEMLSLAEGTVKSYLFRAVQRLQEELSFYRKELGMEEQQ